MTDEAQGDWQRTPEAPNCVTVFGGGIAGLSAAHELIERGFRVQVWEPVTDQRYPHRGCDVGGLARTQWSRVAWPDRKDLNCFHEQSGRSKDEPLVPTNPIVHLPQRFAVYYPEFDTGLPLHVWKRVTEAEIDAWDEDSAYPAWTRVAQLPTDGVLGYEINLRGYETWSEAQRFERIGHVWSTLEQALPATQCVAPEFDRRARVFKGQIGDIEVVLLGDFPGHLDPNVAAVARAFHDNTSELEEPGYALGWARRIDEQHIRGLSQDGTVPNDPIDVLVEVVQTLVDNPQIDIVYVEVSDRQPIRHQKLAQREANALVTWFQETFSRLSAAPPFTATENWTVYEATLHGLLPLTVPDANQGPTRWTTGSKMSLNIAPTGGGGQRTTRDVELQIVVLDRFPADFPKELPDDLRFYVNLRVRERWLPGEHGYRFFPAFYHHLFDTMKRTPILEPQAKSELALAQERALGFTYPEPVRYVETGRTAFDNIRSTRSHVLAFSDGRRPSELSRLRLRSFEELRRMVQVALNDRAGGFGVSPRDLYRLSLKVVEFLTSCNERRKELESQSWWDFVEGDTYAPSTQRLLQRWPEALVAMDARVADARTHGLAMVQLILDNFHSDGYRDGTLVAPTSEAWLNPWRRYLEAQGVEFVHGKLTGFEIVEPGADAPEGTRPVVWPVVECYEPRAARSAETGEPLLMPGYFVLAVSADNATELANQYLQTLAGSKLTSAPAERSDFRKLARLGRENRTITDNGQVGPKVRTKAFEQATGTRDFRHYGGIQFYFAEDVYWVEGHVYHVDSRWSLTSVSQARFWQDRTDWEHGYRGVLSVVIGSWQIPGLCGKCAWECEPQLLAEEVWAQIKQGLSRSQEHDVGGRRAPLDTLGGDDVPDPLYWHLDDRMQWDPDARHYRNATPFFISTPGGRADRPGDPERGYTVEHGFVWAGMHCRTFSRIPSMEAANESARHAVNAILRKQTDNERRFRRTLCDIWNPEDREIEDLRFAQDLDAKLCERRLPHAMRLFDIDRLAATTLRGGPHDPLDPIQLSAHARRLWQRFSGGRRR